MEPLDCCGCVYYLLGMEFSFWIQIAIAVMLGNALTVSVAYFFAKLYRHEILRGKHGDTLPFWVYLFFLVPVTVAFGVVYNLA